MPRQTRLSTLLGSDPRDPFGDITGEFDRFLGRLRGGLALTASAGQGLRTVTPRADIAETDDTVRIEMDLPGVKAEDIDIEFIDKMLSITGKRHTESERDENDYHIVERSHGEFRRRIPLGFDVDEKAIKAEFNDGVLSITVDKPDDSRNAPKKIRVEGGSSARIEDRQASGEAAATSSKDDSKRTKTASETA